MQDIFRMKIWPEKGMTNTFGLLFFKFFWTFVKVSSHKNRIRHWMEGSDRQQATQQLFTWQETAVSLFLYRYY